MRNGIPPTNEVLNQRIGVVETAISTMTTELSRMSSDWRKAMADQDAEFRREISAATQNLSNKMDNISGDLKKRSEIPWQALGVILTFVAIIGALAYWPVRERQAEFAENLKIVMVAQAALLDTVRTQYVSRAETDVLRERSKEERERSNRVIEKLTDDVVPRAEHMEHWKSVDTSISYLQRQIDDISRRIGDTYTARDAILDLKAQLKDVEARLQRATP